MRLLSQPEELRPPSGKVCAAIGVFDGVHIGHQSVIRRMLADAALHGATPVVVTFDRHPRSLLSPQATPLLIQTQSQKLKSFESMGVQAVWMVQFDLPFSQIQGRDFVLSMQRGFGCLASVAVGTDFHFGFKRSGNAALLADWGAELGFQTHPIPPVEFDGLPVSSTRVRECIQKGNLTEASGLLGRPYALAGPVIRGDQIGRKLGFPTANVQTKGMVLPPSGVYSARCRIQEQQIRVALNIGVRPTVNQPTPQTQVEAHLIDWTGDLYEQELEIELRDQIRAEQKFPSLEALKARIGLDVETIRQQPL